MSDANPPAVPVFGAGRKHMWRRLEVVEKQINSAVILDWGQEKATRSDNRPVPSVKQLQPINRNLG